MGSSEIVKSVIFYRIVGKPTTSAKLAIENENLVLDT